MFNSQFPIRGKQAPIESPDGNWELNTGQVPSGTESERSFRHDNATGCQDLHLGDVADGFAGR